MPKSLHTLEYDVFLDMLRTARQERGLRQVDLAKLLDQPQSVVSKMERGERRVDIVEILVIADAVQVDPIEFIRACRKTIGELKRQAGSI